ncbi:MAG: phosphate ABC transporter substrate-binding protein [Oscillospiraceae bacterium]|nr:phosphate ABC transporter substrate-binding protein [Oscillospiraceae bacterium]
MKYKICIILLVALICTVLMTSCGEEEGTKIVIAGSTSVQPYAEILSEDYEALASEIKVIINGGGSSAGISAVMKNVADIGMSSRSLNEKESGLWSVEIAKDGLALIIHPDNPVTNLSIEQIRGIYTQEITNWSELGGVNHKIHVISREEGSGTRSAFSDMVMDGARITPKAIVQNSNGAVRQLVSGDKYAIGFISLGLVEHQDGLKPVKGLSINGITPIRENVINGSYNLFRPFLFVSNKEPEGTVKDFIDFILSEHGQQILIDEGLISVSPEKEIG